MFFGSQLPAFATEANALETNVNDNKIAAALSAAAAATSATTATSKADAALTSANNAELSKTGAYTARDDALAAQAAANLALDSFDDRYLGAKAVAPTLDNDGNALLIGAIYFDTVIGSGTWCAWNGSSWVTAPAANASAIINTPAGNIAATTVQTAINELDTEKAKAGANTDITSLGGLTSSVKAANGSFHKADPTTVAFTKLTAGTAKIKAGTVVDVNGTIVSFASDAAITMPTLTAGTDYAIYACTDGSIRADASFSSPSGYTTANSRRIGGFHYAPGGNAAAQAGGDTTPAINAYSFWDLKFKPTCPDPRGMTLVANGFWTDIYLTGVDHYINGTSKYNVAIADGQSPPKIPALFGGNGSTAYSTFNWFEAGEVSRSHGKRLPTYDEFCALAYGTTEAASAGTDPVSTILRAAYTSKWGVMLATGNLWQWGAEFGGGAAAATWTANTGGRGLTYQMASAATFGGHWGDTTNSGSRCSFWFLSPSSSGATVSSRCACDHLILE